MSLTLTTRMSINAFSSLESAEQLVEKLVASRWTPIVANLLAMLLLELKTALEGLSERIPSEEIITFTTFLLLTVVILPAVPDRDFTRFHLNPFKTWVIVAAVSAVSYGSYVLQRVTRRKGGVVLAALLGPSLAAAQNITGQVEGVVTDAATGKARSCGCNRKERPHIFRPGGRRPHRRGPHAYVHLR